MRMQKPKAQQKRTSKKGMGFIYSAERNFCKPLPSQQIIKLIARLQIICPEKNKTQYDTEARTSIWVEELSKYPADIVTYALRRRYKWFPTLSEVLDNCDNEMAYRKLIERGIRVAGWR